MIYYFRVVHIPLSDGKHYYLIAFYSVVLKMHTVYPARKLIYPFAHVSAAVVYPIAVESYFHSLGREQFKQSVKQELAACALEFKGVVMVGKYFSRGGNFLNRTLKVLLKIAKRIFRAVAFGHGTDTYIFAIHHIVLRQNGSGIAEYSVRRDMCNSYLKSQSVTYTPELVCLDLSDAGYLNAGIAYFCHTFKSALNFIGSFHLISERIQLCADFHKQSAFLFLIIAFYIEFLIAYYNFYIAKIAILCYYKIMHTKNYKNKTLNVRFSVSDGGEDNIIIHCHTDYEILYFIRGNVQYIIEGAEYNLTSGSLLLIPPNVVHGVKACGDGTYQRCVLSIHPESFGYDGMKLLRSVFCRECYYENTDGYDIGGAFDDIFNAAELGDYALDVSVQALIIKILHMQNTLQASEPKIAASSAVAQIITYLNENFTAKVTLDGISSKFFVSKHHLNKLFRRATGVTVGEYVIYKRVYYARGLIQRGVRASEAAERAGFSDYSAFYKAYLKRMGHNPQSDSPDAVN